ncbi:tetratricopeptide repeat protein [Myceligenerans xiligouense]|uniref:Tetratricopeptide (TPR) repeat protein n=1 Tax=Myceligenerans xiligouense TaxID=253184 RepID=A0A3N4ZNL7_9MICO|nr:tetratricopeptide repeat protein [Myceligenerans xiligouense]RPF21461.1 tetratricopeptide (TPR) repeat protein [Myceligenerans xiligouense]
MEIARNVLLTYMRHGQLGRFRGSGFHLRENLVLTADHCADGSDYQVWQSGAMLEGRVVWRTGQASVDLALLEVDGLPEVEPVPLAVLDTAAGGVLEDCACGCYPSFGRLDPSGEGGSSGPDRLVPLVGNLLLDSAHAARIPDGWVGDGRIALSLTSDRSLLPDVRGTADEVTRAWSAASGGAVLATVSGQQFCVGVISARQVKETPTALRMAGFNLLDGLGPDAAAGFWDRIGVPGLAGLVTVGGMVRADQVIIGRVPRRAPGHVDRDVTAVLLELVTGHGLATVVSLAGLRGVGKSQTAAEVARHCMQQGWPVVAWVNAETRDTAVSDLRLLADRAAAVAQGESPEDSVRRMYSLWAADPAVSRLVVFDNLADARDLNGLLPPEGAAAVVVTTADRSVAVGEVLDVGVFTPGQAIGFLQEGTTFTDPDAAGGVADELGRLPLALAAAVWTVTRRRRFDHAYGYDQYLKELDRRPLDRLLGDVKATPEYPRATIAALALAVDAALEAAADRELVQRVLGALALLDPSGVPRRWLEVLGERFDIDDALAVIADSGLAQPSEDAAGVIMHRLVARVISEISQHAQWPAPAMAAAEIVHAVNPLDRDTYWAQRTEALFLARHFLALSHAPDADVSQELITTGLRTGYVLHALSDHYTAITLLRRLLDAAARVLGTDHPDTLASRNNLAFAYQSVGNLQRAIPLFEATVTASERVLGTNHPGTLFSRCNLAGAYRSTGDSQRAIRLYVGTLKKMKRVLGMSHPNTLTLRDNLAFTYESVGDFERAIPLYESTLSDRERVLGVDHRDTLTSRDHLAGAYESVGDLRRAIPLYEKTLTDTERLLGADHPDTLMSRSNLAYAYQSSGDLRRTIPLYENTLSDRERVLGMDHPNTLASRNNLAGAYQSVGDLNRAFPLYERTLSDRERVLGALHPDTLESRGNLAGAFQSAGDLRRAIPLFEETLSDQGRVLGPDHPDTLKLQGILAGAYARAGDLQRAIPLHEKTLTDTERVLGSNHPDTLALRINLAAVCESAGDLQRAIPLYEKTLADAERVLGVDHPDTLTTRISLAGAFQSAGDLGRAIPLLEETLSDRERVLGPDHPDTLNSQGKLADAYASAGDLQYALPLYKKTLTDTERVLGDDHPHTLTSRSNLAGAYLSAGNALRAVRLFEETLGDQERVLGPDHPDSLASRSNLAGGYRAMGDLRRAIPLYEKTLTDTERVLGADHPHALAIQTNLASAYHSVGDLRRATPLLEKTYADSERVLGPDHPMTLASRENLALAMAHGGDDEKALTLAGFNASESQRLFGAEDSRTLNRHDTIALVLLVGGHVHEAVKLLIPLLADCRRILGDHEVTRTVEQRLAHVTAADSSPANQSSD